MGFERLTNVLHFVYQDPHSDFFSVSTREAHLQENQILLRLNVVALDGIRTQADSQNKV